jgi:hypothetical protein
MGAVTGFNIISFPPPFAHRFHFLLEVLNSVRTGPARIAITSAKSRADIRLGAKRKSNE